MRKLVIFGMVILVAVASYAAPPTRQFTYSTGSTINASEVTANEDAIFNYLSSGVDTYLTASITAAAIATNAVEAAEIAANAVGNSEIDNTAALSVSGITVTGRLKDAGSSEGAIGQYLRRASSGTDWGAQSVAISNATYNTDLGSGTQRVTVGFQPTFVIVFSAITNTAGNMSVGYSDGTNQICLFDKHATNANAYQVAASQSIRMLQSGADMEGDVTFYSNGFDITWTETGDTAGTITVGYLAIQ